MCIGIVLVEWIFIYGEVLTFINGYKPLWNRSIKEAFIA